MCRGDVQGVFGYFEERLCRDKRYRMASALHHGNLLGTNAARAAMNNAAPVLPATHALNSMIPGLTR